MSSLIRIKLSLNFWSEQLCLQRPLTADPPPPPPAFMTEKEKITCKYGSIYENVFYYRRNVNRNNFSSYSIPSHYLHSLFFQKYSSGNIILQLRRSYSRTDVNNSFYVNFHEYVYGIWESAIAFEMAVNEICLRNHCCHNSRMHSSISWM